MSDDFAELSRRTRSALTANHIFDIDDLANHTEAEMRLMSGIGAVGLGELVELLRLHRKQWRNPRIPWICPHCGKEIYIDPPRPGRRK